MHSIERDSKYPLRKILYPAWITYTTAPGKWFTKIPNNRGIHINPNSETSHQRSLIVDAVEVHIVVDLLGADQCAIVERRDGSYEILIRIYARHDLGDLVVQRIEIGH